MLAPAQPRASTLYNNRTANLGLWRRALRVDGAECTITYLHKTQNTNNYEPSLACMDSPSNFQHGKEIRTLYNENEPSGLQPCALRIASTENTISLSHQMLKVHNSKTNVVPRLQGHTLELQAQKVHGNTIQQKKAHSGSWPCASDTTTTACALTRAHETLKNHISNSKAIPRLQISTLELRVQDAARLPETTAWHRAPRGWIPLDRAPDPGLLFSPLVALLITEPPRWKAASS